MWSPSDARGWNIIWHRRLFVWETTLLEDLLHFLRPVTLSSEVDSWSWRLEPGGEFTVKSAYALVSDFLIERRTVAQDVGSAFKSIWNCPAPSKVSGLVWMVLHERVPARDNLFRRKVIPVNGETRCVLCGDSRETVSHLFLYCRVTLQVWERVLPWLGIYFSLPQSICSLLNFVAEIPGTKQKKKGAIMIWCAVIWSVWRHRNRIIFDNRTVDRDSLVDDVQIASWRWWLGRTKASPCLFYEWLAEPGFCMNR
jgi:hypothetical protein